MESKKYTISTNLEEKKITIKNIAEEPIILDYNSDISFTSFVSALTSLIDDKVLLENENPNENITTDSTLNLILDTINQIISKYNDAIQSPQNTKSTLDSLEENRNIDWIDNSLPFLTIQYPHEYHWNWIEYKGACSLFL